MEIKNREDKYCAIRDYIVNNFNTKNIMRLVLDLLSNLKDCEFDEVNKERNGLYESFIFDLNEITRDWN